MAHTQVVLRKSDLHDEGGVGNIESSGGDIRADQDAALTIPSLEHCTSKSEVNLGLMILPEQVQCFGALFETHGIQQTRGDQTVPIGVWLDGMHRGLHCLHQSLNVFYILAICEDDSLEAISAASYG